ncbi:MAG: glycoside hydrolase family 18 protein [Phycisphaerales bacterium]|nr:glycoside hydrolase family 18 protein [Phycisphaerales bacterium]
MKSSHLIPLLALASLHVAGCRTSGQSTVAEQAGPPGFKVIGFFGGGEWRYQRLTHVIPGFLAFDADGSLADWDLKAYCHEAHAAGVKVIVSFDGEHWERNFLPMSDNADGSRDRFIANIHRYCLENGVDGVDYDWEIMGGFSPAHQELYSELVIATKEAFAQDALTVSIDAYFRNELDARGIAAVDWIQLMAYKDLAEMRQMVDYWIDRGVPPEKLVIGMAAGWGEEGVGTNTSLARAKTSHSLDHGHGGVMLFRTDLDSEDGSSMLQAVQETVNSAIRKGRN